MDKTYSHNRWPREVFIFSQSGCKIRFQESLIGSPLHDTDSDSEKDLSELVAETEAKFALHYPNILASSRSRKICNQMQFNSSVTLSLTCTLLSVGSSTACSSTSTSVKSVVNSPPHIPPRVIRVLTVDEKKMKRIEALQKLEDLQFEQCTFRSHKFFDPLLYSDTPFLTFHWQKHHRFCPNLFIHCLRRLFRDLF